MLTWRDEQHIVVYVGFQHHPHSSQSTLRMVVCDRAEPLKGIEPRSLSQVKSLIQAMGINPIFLHGLNLLKPKLRFL